jgi:hypothetical protein
MAGSSSSVSHSESFSDSYIPEYSETPILQEIAQHARAMSDTVYNWGMDRFNKNQGDIDRLMSDALQYASPQRIAVDMGMAEAGVQQAAERGRQSAVRDLESYGIDPSSGRYAALDSANRVMSAAAAAGAGNQQRMADQAAGNAMRNQAISASLQNANYASSVNRDANAFLATASSLKYPPLGRFSTSTSDSSSQSVQTDPAKDSGGAKSPQEKAPAQPRQQAQGAGKPGNSGAKEIKPPPKKLEPPKKPEEPEEPGKPKQPGEEPGGGDGKKPAVDPNEGIPISPGESGAEPPEVWGGPAPLESGAEPPEVWGGPAPLESGAEPPEAWSYSPDLGDDPNVGAGGQDFGDDPNAGTPASDQSGAGSFDESGFEGYDPYLNNPAAGMMSDNTIDPNTGLPYTDQSQEAGAADPAGGLYTGDWSGNLMPASYTGEQIGTDEWSDIGQGNYDSAYDGAASVDEAGFADYGDTGAPSFDEGGFGDYGDTGGYDGGYGDYSDYGDFGDYGPGGDYGGDEYYDDSGNYDYGDYSDYGDYGDYGEGGDYGGDEYYDDTSEYEDYGDYGEQGDYGGDEYYDDAGDDSYEDYSGGGGEDYYDTGGDGSEYDSSGDSGDGGGGSEYDDYSGYSGGGGEDYYDSGGGDGEDTGARGGAVMRGRMQRGQRRARIMPPGARPPQRPRTGYGQRPAFARGGRVPPQQPPGGAMRLAPPPQPPRPMRGAPMPNRGGPRPAPMGRGPMAPGDMISANGMPPPVQGGMQRPQRMAQGGGAGRRAEPTTGGFVSHEMSPSGGSTTDDVQARLNAGEFVVPKDVAAWKGKEFFYKLIAQARANRSGGGKPDKAQSGYSNGGNPPGRGMR